MSIRRGTMTLHGISVHEPVVDSLIRVTYKGDMELTRRTLIRGVVGLLAAPAVVRLANLMPVKAWAEELVWVNSRGLPVAGQPFLVGKGWPPVDYLHLVEPLYLPNWQVGYDESPALNKPKRWALFKQASGR